MSAKKKEPIVGLYSKTRDELTRTGDSWICLMPSNKRNTDQAIANGEEEWIPNPTRPLRLLIVQNKVKTWISALDLALILDIYKDNKDAVDATFAMVGRREREKSKALESLFEE